MCVGLSSGGWNTTTKAGGCEKVHSQLPTPRAEAMKQTAHTAIALFATGPHSYSSLSLSLVDLAEDVIECMFWVL